MPARMANSRHSVNLPMTPEFRRVLNHGGAARSHRKHVVWRMERADGDEMGSAREPGNQ
ncbi:hypothetical protein F01_450058 [Burkholderia cenocepacia]|nr:hypothetical protein F01_450058 [Burkholderia cenocepacia]